MSERNDETFDRLKRFFSNPLSNLGLVAVGILLIPLAAKMQSMPEARERFRQRMAKDAAEREQIRRDADLRRRRTNAEHAYLYNDGPGERRVRHLGMVTVGPIGPMADAVVENMSSEFQHGFRVRSRQAEATLQASWDRDGFGGLFLQFDDGMKWSLATFGGGGKEFIQQENDLVRPTKPGYLAFDDPRATKTAAALLASKAGRPESITFHKDDYFDIRRRVWDEFLDAHPELESDMDREARKRR